MANFQEFLHETQFDDLSDEVLEFARRWLLDLLGVAAGGAQTKLSVIIRNHALRQFGANGAGARMLFDGRRVSAAGADLAGGFTIDALDGHDGHKLTKGHTGCGVLPALLAFFDAENLEDDSKFLTSFVLGYEIATRAGIALHKTACDYHTSGAWVSIGAAAMGARLLGLSLQETREAIGIAEYHGPRSQMMRAVDYPTMLKDGSGWGSMAGVSAAYLAKDGFTGAPALTVEGEDVREIWADLGKRWIIFDQYFKYYPVCRWAQPPVQAVLDLRKKHSLRSEDVAQIEINTFHQSKRLAVRAPKTTEEAQYSTAYPVAVAMVRGRILPEDVMEASFEDAEIKRLAAGMVIGEKDEYNAAFPARRFADVALVLKDGRRSQSETVEALGDPENPAPIADIREKFLAYTKPVLGEARSAAIENEVMTLGDGGGISNLLKLTLAPK